MTGSLTQKHGKYYVIIRIEDTNGKRTQKWVNTGIPTEGNNKRKALNAMKEILNEYEAKSALAPCDDLFTEWVKKWLEQKKSTVRLNTYEGYKLYFDKYIEPYFKELNVTLKDVKPQQVQDYYNKLFADGLCANSIKKHHVVIHGALKDAYRKSIIPNDPASTELVTLPKQIEHFVGKAYSLDEAKELLKAAKGETLEPAIILGLRYGLRRSEVAGLRWQDIDFDKGTLTVCNTVTKLVTQTEQQETKSEASHRTMILMDDEKVFLKALKQQQDNNKELLGSEYHESDHVCVWEDGREIPPDYLTHGFEKLLKRHSLPKIRFHDLRHTTGSLLLEKGLSVKQIQEYLGHEKVTTTLDIYGHLSADGKRQAADSISSLLSI